MNTEVTDKAAASRRSLELVVAAALFALGIILIVDSRRIGTGWADDGPQAGYFPFYIGLLLCAASVINLVASLRNAKHASEVFLTRTQLKMVLSLLIPTTIFVLAIKWIGIYVASTILIAWFMKRLGGFSYLKTAAVSIGVSAFLFAMFEIWFKVPLPKGPLEAAFGFA